MLAHVFYLEDAKRLVDQGIDGFVHMVRDQPIDQALIDTMLKQGTWQAAGTLSREAAMFAYGSTPEFAADPFFTRGVSAKTLELIKSPERQKTQAGRKRRRPSSAFSCLKGPLHAIAKTMKSSSKLSALPNRCSVLVMPLHPAKAGLHKYLGLRR